MLYDFDLFVIGGGSGGVRCARIAAGHGAKVAVAEERFWGGTCVNVGCVPKKLLVMAAEYGLAGQDRAGFGWEAAAARHDWPALIAAKDREISRLNGVYRRLLEGSGCTVFESRATFLDAHTLEVGDRRVTAERIVIATGGRPVRPDFPGAEHAIISDDAFFLPDLPRRIVLLGGGYIAVEFAGIFAGLGAEVDLVYRQPWPLRGFDEDLRSDLAEALGENGIRLHPATTIASVAAAAAEKTVTLADGTVLTADLVFAATGRQPNTEGLGLDRAGVTTDGAGAVLVDGAGNTSAENIFAIGDVTNRLNLTPVAIAEGHALADRLFGGARREWCFQAVATAVFSSPPIGTVGLTEDQAAARGPADIFLTRFTPMRHTLSGRSRRTLIKLVVDQRTQLVVGAHMLGEDAPEIIQGLSIAINCGATKQDFDRTVGVHPTAAEEFVTLRNRTRVTPGPVAAPVPEPETAAIPADSFPAAAPDARENQFCRIARVVPQSGTALLALLFLLFGLFGVASLTVLMPPFENPDEPARFMRAYQISRLVLIGHQLGPKEAGGAIDTGIVQAFSPILSPPPGSDGKVTPEMLRQAAAAVWTGTETEVSFPATTRDPPLFYAPAAAAIRIGEHAHLTVVSTLQLARALTGATAVLIGAAAIAGAGAAAPWLFGLLALPASLAQFASPSPEALMTALAAAAAVVIARAVQQGAAPSLLAFWGTVAALGLIVQAWPLYAPLALLLLLLPRPGLRQRLAGVAVVLAAGAAWAGYAALQTPPVFDRVVPPGTEIDVAAQFNLLVQEPARVLAVLANTARSSGRDIWDGVTGQPGWLDVVFPRPYSQAASVGLGLAALLSLRGQPPLPRRIVAPLLRALAVLLILALSVLAILVARYLTDTVVGGDAVAGIQGRYFLPVLVLAAAALPLYWPAKRLTGLWTALFAAVAVFPLVSLATTLRLIVLRYFL